jgi:hypothetical protein
VLEMMEMLGEELDVERALEEYAGMLPMEETIAATVTNRVLTRTLQSAAPAARAGRPAAPRREPTQRPFENVFRDPPRGDGLRADGPRKRR